MKHARPAITAFLVGVLVGMLILATVHTVVSETIVVCALLALGTLWILPAWLAKGRKAVKRRLSSKTNGRCVAARKKGAE